MHGAEGFGAAQPTSCSGDLSGGRVGRRRVTVHHADAPDPRVAGFDAAAAATAVLGVDGTIIVTNRAWWLFAAINGGDPAALSTGSYLDVCAAAARSGDAHAVAALDLISDLLAGRRSHVELEYPCDAPHEQRWFLLQAAPVPGGGAVVTHVDISRRKALEARLTHLAEHDPLTGLANRTRIQRALADMAPAQAVLVCDLDGFKDVNDRFGHATGDELLVQVAGRLRLVAPPGALVGRLGGDEFVLAAPVVDDRSIGELAAAVEATLERPYQVGAAEHVLGCSVGAAATTVGEDADDVLRRADAAMYERKRVRTRGRQRAFLGA